MLGDNRCGPVSTSGGKETPRGANREDTFELSDASLTVGSKGTGNVVRSEEENNEKERGDEVAHGPRLEFAGRIGLLRSRGEEELSDSPRRVLFFFLSFFSFLPRLSFFLSFY